MNKVWIACDWHLWNRNNNYSHPYRSISSIGKLSDNYTTGISPTDIFVHLGDIADPEKADKEKLKAIIQSIPAGYKVLCKGNHDTEPDDYYYDLGFDVVCEICTIYNVVLSHFPVKVNEDEVNVHAHLHSEKLSSLGYQHINAYKANFNDGPTSLDDLLDTAIFQDEAEYKSTDMMHYEKKFTEYTSAMFGNRFTQIVDISDKVPLAPIEESAKPQLDDSDADTILNEILFDDVEDTQYWMADDDAYHDTVRKAEDNQTTSMVTIAETVDVSKYADIYTSRITELTDDANQDESMFKHISKLTHVPVEQLPKFSPKLTVKTDKQLCFEMLPSNIPWKIRVEYERFLLKIIKKLNKTKADLPYTGTIWTADGDCLLYVNLNDTPMNEMYLSSLSATGAHAEEILNDDTESLKEMTPEEKKKIADKYGLKSTGVYREKETEANKIAEDRKKERDQKRLEDLKKARKIHKRNSRIRRIKKKIPFIKNESMGDTAVDTDINSLYDQPPTEQGGLFDGQIRYFHGLYDSEAYVETTMRSTVQHDYVKKGSKNLNSFKQVKVTKDWIKRYKDRYPRLKHLRESDDINTTYAWMDKDDLVAVLNVAVDDKSIKWISNLEVTPDYRGYGLSSQLLDYATKNLKATHLGVADDNALAIDIYKKYGFHFTNEKHNHIQIMSLSGKSQSIQESYQFKLLDNVKFIEPLQEAAEEYKDEPLYPVYIMLIHSGSALANAIKFATQSNFSHSSISFDASMTNMYSFGRKADTNPFAGGFKKESIKSQFYTSRTIPYALYMVACTKSQVDQMKKRLNYFIKNSSKFKYDFTGLFKNYFGIADNPEYQWFCSRFVADILNAGRPSEHPYVVEPSLMKPEDFMHTTYAHYVTGGVLSNYDVKAVEKKVRTMLKLERMNRMLEAQKIAVNEASNMLDESVKAHTETLYRVTYHGIGIYEAFKKACSFDEWKAFKDSDAATWLDVPTIYNQDIDHASYFTKKGYEAFKKNTYPVMIQKLNKNDIKVDKVSVDTKPVYTDRYQVVIPTAISESVVFDLDPFNPFQSATLKYQLSQMDESATEQFLDYIRSFKIRIDKNGNIRVTRREYDQLDQHFRRSVRITKAAIKAGNTAMVKDELCKVYYMVSLIDNHYSKLPPVTTDPKQKQVRKDLLDLRSVMLNMFNQNLKYVTVAEPNFNFNSYYASSKYGKDVTIPKQIVTAVGKTIITLL